MRVLAMAAVSVMILRSPALADGAAKLGDRTTATVSGPNVDMIPPGETWSCYTALLVSAGKSEQLSECFRSARNCKRAADVAREGIAPAMIVDGSFECSVVKRVAAFTARSVVQDAPAHREFLNLADCIDVRKAYENPDNDQLSTCGVVGESQASSFRPENVPNGHGWYCTRLPSGARLLPEVSVCRRTKAECNALEKTMNVVARCGFQPSAYVVTGMDGSYWTSDSAQSCEDQVDVIFGAPKASACVVVK